jgi:phospholipid/cholesterol/gamma-HCH transport system permease protein
VSVSVLTDFGTGLKRAVAKLGAISVFATRVMACLPYVAMRPRLVTRQIYNAGLVSLVIILTSGFFVGLVLGLQGYDSLSRIRQEDILGAGVALTLLKELGPVVTALLFAGRAGTALASEIGLMRATDQLSAMEVMAVDPLARVVAPRFLGGAISMPLLAGIFSSVALLGTYIIGVVVKGIDAGAFWMQMREYVELGDVYEGIFKSFVFGIVGSMIAVFEGYTAAPTAEGVGTATTRTVVNTAIAVLFFDYIITGFLL